MMQQWRGGLVHLKSAKIGKLEAENIQRAGCTGRLKGLELKLNTNRSEI